MKNEVLNKLFKIASSHQKILNKLAQETTDQAEIEKAITDFVKYQLVTWGLPHNITAQENIICKKNSPQDYEVNVKLTLANKENLHVVDDPGIGFAKTLQQKVSSEPMLKNINVKFNVEAI